MEAARILVGTWEWIDQSEGVTVSHQLTLSEDGTYAYTTSRDTDQLTATGAWHYQGGWLQFHTEWSSSLDPAGNPVAQGPIQILELGPDFVRLPGGTGPPRRVRLRLFAETRR